MCTAPILIKNPYFDRGSTFEHKGQKVRLRIGGNFDYLHDTISQYVQVPCGQCASCVSNRQSFYNQRIQMESLRSEMFSFMLSYANRGLRYCDHPDYKKIAYPYYYDIQFLFKRLRKIMPCPIRYFVVSEYGSKRKRPHYHGIIAVSKEDIKKYFRGSYVYCEKVLFRDVLRLWQRNISSSRKNPQYINLCDYVVRGNKRTYDLHWIQPILNHDNDLSFYITKYILKYDERTRKLLYKIQKDPNLSLEDTKLLISQIKPRAYMSKDFGDYRYPPIAEHIKLGLLKHKDFPAFIDINTGKLSLLTRYYRNRFVTLDMKFEKFWDYLKDIQYLDIPHTLDSYNPEYLAEEIIHDINSQRFRSTLKDKRFSRVKNLLDKR